MAVKNLTQNEWEVVTEVVHLQIERLQEKHRAGEINSVDLNTEVAALRRALIKLAQIAPEG